MRNSLAQKIASLRAKAGLTQEQLANLAGVKTATVGMIERDETMPRNGTVKAIARALGCSEKQLTNHIQQRR